MSIGTHADQKASGAAARQWQLPHASSAPPAALAAAALAAASEAAQCCGCSASAMMKRPPGRSARSTERKTEHTLVRERSRLIAPKVMAPSKAFSGTHPSAPSDATHAFTGGVSADAW